MARNNSHTTSTTSTTTLELVVPTTEQDFRDFASIHSLGFADKCTTFSDSLAMIRRIAHHYPEKLQHYRIVRDNNTTNGEVVGSIVLQLPGDIGDVSFPFCLRHVCRDKEAYIETVATHPMRRGMGIGSLLLRWAETCAIDHHCSSIALHVMTRNTGAARLYERLGYVIEHSHDGIGRRFGVGTLCCLISCGKYFGFHYMVKPLLLLPPPTANTAAAAAGSAVAGETPRVLPPPLPPLLSMAVVVVEPTTTTMKRE
jgi:ribosomal protein S18 acetylase RimI-like enzyme